MILHSWSQNMDVNIGFRKQKNQQQKTKEKKRQIAKLSHLVKNQGSFIPNHSRSKPKWIRFTLRKFKNQTLST